MAKTVKNSINEQIFTALKVAELSGVPTLIISNPGVGKSSSVEEFARIRGYHLIVLRGNSTTADEICGYDTVPAGVTEGERRGAVGLRPSWFQKLMSEHDKGNKTLLFLDEITTSPEYTQAALLHLVFERSCKDEKFPKDTLIVAAGNYATNLSASMQLLPPMMNRFMIFNIVPKVDDICTFLNYFQGASCGEPINKQEVLNRLFDTLNKQELKLDDKVMFNRIGEIFEHAVCQTAESLCNSKKIDWNVTDLSTIYSDSDPNAVDTRLKGFATLRTLGYLVKWAIATYQAFGAAGIKSVNFKNAVAGLCGIGLSRGDKSSHNEVKQNDITEDFFQAIKTSLADVEKLSNTALPEYDNFFRTLLGAEHFKKEDLVSLVNKVKALKVDNNLKNVDRPIDEQLMAELESKLIKTGHAFSQELKAKYPTTPTPDVIKEEGNHYLESVGGFTEKWNSISAAYNILAELGADSSKNYSANVITGLSETAEKLGAFQAQLQCIRKLVINALSIKSLDSTSLPKLDSITNYSKTRRI